MEDKSFRSEAFKGLFVFFLIAFNAWQQLGDGFEIDFYVLIFAQFWTGVDDVTYALRQAIQNSILSCWYLWDILPQLILSL